jgi:hypothetical protein
MARRVSIRVPLAGRPKHVVRPLAYAVRARLNQWREWGRMVATDSLALGGDWEHPYNCLSGTQCLWSFADLLTTGTGKVSGWVVEEGGMEFACGYGYKRQG